MYIFFDVEMCIRDSITAARKLIPSKADSVLPDVQSLSVL